MGTTLPADQRGSMHAWVQLACPKHQSRHGLPHCPGSPQGLINSFLAHFSGLASFLEATKAAARESGCVRTLAGRVRPISGLASTDKRVRAEAERKAVNTTIQASSGQERRGGAGWD